MPTTDKEWDRARPFVRIGSPSEDPSKPRLDGLGHERGTRNQDDYKPAPSVLEAVVVSRLIALTPSWASTMGTTEAEAEHEVFGRLRRSFQTWTDAPPLQWHRWYDWNFHIEPEDGYQWLRGRGNTDTPKKADPVLAAKPLPKRTRTNEEEIRRARKAREEARLEAVVQGRCMELEWDTGAFGDIPGGMFNSGGRRGIDWAWPMTTDFLWARGRSIYDGGHEEELKGITEEETAKARKPRGRFDPNPPPPKKPEPPKVTRSELHPCKAIASARWEAHKFAGNPHFIPAIQFMFFSSRLGGYKDFKSLEPSSGGNYTFIVDLPATAVTFTPMTLDVGATSDFPFNRIVLRDDPLVEFDFERFMNAKGNRPGKGDALAQFENFKKFPPVVELLPAKGDKKKRQVKVTIPIVDFAKAHPEADFYGVVISMGWPDPALEQAKKVKKCTFKFVALDKAAIDHDTFKEEWRFKAGVNGRWFQFDFGKVSNNTTRELDREVTLHLCEDDEIRVSAHGAELDLVDDVYSSPRTVRISPQDISDAGGQRSTDTTERDVVWEKDVEVTPRDPATKRFIAVGSAPVQRAVAFKIFDMMFTTFNDQNEPLGIIDPKEGNQTEKTFNPITVKDFVARFGEGKPHEFALRAMRTEEVGESAELAQVAPDLAKLDDVDYTLRYTIQIDPQVQKSP